jgi:hypothetical protein
MWEYFGAFIAKKIQYVQIERDSSDNNKFTLIDFLPL